MGGGAGLEALLLALSSSYREMTVFCPIIFSKPTGVMQVAKTEFVERGLVRTKAVSDDAFRRPWLVPEELCEKPECCCGVPAALHNEFKHNALVIDRSPQVPAFSCD